MPRIVAMQSVILQNHVDAGLKRVIDEILRQLQPAQKNLLKILEESRAEVAILAATVTEMRGLRNEPWPQSGRMQ
jgi:low affinity Fe/Cu permease